MLEFSIEEKSDISGTSAPSTARMSMMVGCSASGATMGAGTCARMTRNMATGVMTGLS